MNRIETSIRFLALAARKGRKHIDVNPGATAHLFHLPLRQAHRDFMIKSCDRKWAELNRRLNQLERIVSRLDLPRESISNDTRSAPTQSESKEENDSADNPAETETRSVEITPTDSDTNRDGMSTGGDMDELITQPEDDLKSPELTLLINAYNQKTKQALWNCSHIYKLRDSIENSKDKRDSAVSAIIVRTRTEKQHEVEHELQNVAASRAASEQDELHEKCAGIAANLAVKDKDLARLQKQLQSLSSLPVSTEESNCAQGRREARELSSQIRRERASKVSLETERQKIFMRLVKSSHHVHVLVSRELASKM
ncbi:hypothetical protein PHYPSEUDO_005443 [Phytophthora pseudosyringae]|uniref:Uncharacterized protein n=1 Tax=Phytophthora pseudosyringae TaxID=221518 RepID=A0A8T1VLV8_9STRA|nr:hypothetical protein PHYPSEUDO_005443 [Phytophthora pseudosyringae]